MDSRWPRPLRDDDKFQPLRHTVTIQGTSGGVTESTTVSLQITASTEAFTLGPAVGTLSVAQGQTTGAVNMTVTNTGSPSFIVSSGSWQQTAVPATYTCSGLPTESTCFFNGTANTITTQLTSVTVGSSTVTVDATTNGGPSSSLHFTLSVTAGVVPPSPPSLSPTAVTFPGQYIGTSGLPQTVTLTAGNGALSIIA